MTDTRQTDNASHYEPRRHCRHGLFVPLLLIGLGVVFLLDQYHIFPAHYVFDNFWPVVFIAFGLDALVLQRARRHVAIGAIAVAVGGALLLRNFGFWDFDVSRLWPLILVAVGISMLFRGPRLRPRRFDHTVGAAWVNPPGEGTDSHLDGISVLGGIQRRVTARDFTGGSILACFGGFQVDLTQADIAGDTAVLEVSALFGGGEVRVPPSWEIDIQGHALLGGYTDETHQMASGGKPKRLVVRGTAVFGGVVIKN